MTSPDTTHGHIRSFGTRRGHITDSQQAAIDRLQALYCIEYAPQPADFAVWFGNAYPVVVEIGCGMGESSVQIAATNPHVNYVGLEVYPAGVGSLLARIEQQDLKNFRVIQHDAVDVFANMFGPDSLNGVNIFFPDPWPKKRHHKRRLVQPAFVELLSSRLTPGAVLHCATDWEPYADQMREVLTCCPHLQDLSPDGSGFIERPPSRPQTKFETRGLALGHVVRDLKFARRKN